MHPVLTHPMSPFQTTVKPRDRTWLPTKLGAVWSAVVTGSTVQQLRVRHADPLQPVCSNGERICHAAVDSQQCRV